MRQCNKINMIQLNELCGLFRLTQTSGTNPGRHVAIIFLHKSFLYCQPLLL